MSDTFENGEYFVGFVTNLGPPDEICSITAYKTDPFILNGGESSGFICFRKGKDVDGKAYNKISQTLKNLGNCKAYLSKTTTDSNQYYTCKAPEEGTTNKAPTTGPSNAPRQDVTYHSCRENIKFAPDQEHHYVNAQNSNNLTESLIAIPGMNTDDCKYINYSQKTSGGKQLAGIVSVIDQNPYAKHSLNITPQNDTKLATGPVPYIKVANLTQQDLDVRMCAENGFTCDNKTIKKGQQNFYNTETNVSADSEDIIVESVAAGVSVVLGPEATLGFGVASIILATTLPSIGGDADAIFGVAAEVTSAEEEAGLLEIVTI